MGGNTSLKSEGSPILLPLKRGAIGIFAVLLIILSQILNEEESASNATTFGRMAPKKMGGSPSDDLGQEEYVRYDPSRFAIVTAFSDNHLLEAISMLRTLTEVRYNGTLYVYLMREVGKEFKESPEIRQEIHKSSLNAEVIDFEVSERYQTYCWKPKVIADFLGNSGHWDRHRATGGLDVFMWTDASTRFEENPQLWARSILEDGVDFVGRLSIMGMGENTHEDTYKYLGLSRNNFKNYTEIASGHFLMNLARNGGAAEQYILRPWINCASRACQTCMAPIGTTKSLTGGVLGPPSTKYVGHRQDQSVLALLTYDFMRRRGGVVQLPGKYMHVGTRRSPDYHINSISSLNQNITAKDKAEAAEVATTTSDKKMVFKMEGGRISRLPPVKANGKAVGTP